MTYLVSHAKLLLISLLITATLAQPIPSVCTPGEPSHGILVKKNVTFEMDWGQISAFDVSFDQKMLYLLLINATDIDHEQGTLVAVDLESMEIANHNSYEFPPKSGPIVDGFGFYVLNETHAVYIYSNEPEPVTISLVNLQSLVIEKTIFEMAAAEYLPIASPSQQLLFFSPELGYNYGRMFDVAEWKLIGMNTTMPGLDGTLGANFVKVMPLDPPQYVISTMRYDLVSMDVTGEHQWEVNHRMHDPLLGYVGTPYSLNTDENGAPKSMFYLYDNDTIANGDQGAVWYDPISLDRIFKIRLNLEDGEDMLRAWADGDIGWISGPCNDMQGDFLQAIPISTTASRDDVRSLYFPHGNPAYMAIALRSGYLIMFDLGESASFGHKAASMAVYETDLK